MKRDTRAVRRRIVVVNADDFGASQRTNRAIMRAFEKSLISSTTVMANMPAFEEACQMARGHHLERSVGLHLNFTLGKPLTPGIAACRGLCDADGCFLPRRTVIWLSEEEVSTLELEIAAQVLACERQGITPTHFDSHNHIHTQFGIATVVIRMAKRLGISSIRLDRNCGPVQDGASAIRRSLAPAYRKARNVRLRFHGLGLTAYFGDARDAAQILRTTNADIEIMVHPRLDDWGRLVDLDGTDLQSRLSALDISGADMCNYYTGARILGKQDLRSAVEGKNESRYEQHRGC